MAETLKDALAEKRAEKKKGEAAKAELPLRPAEPEPEPVEPGEKGTPFGMKLVGLIAAARNVPKNGWNDHWKYHYRRADDVLSAVTAGLVRQRLYVVPLIAAQEREVKVRRYRNNKEYEATDVLVTMTVAIAVHDADEPEKYVTFGPVTSQGQDSGDKAYPKALTLGLKALWSAALMISTGDDPEADARTDQAERVVAPRELSQPPLARPAPAERPTAGDRAVTDAIAEGIGRAARNAPEDENQDRPDEPRSSEPELSGHEDFLEIMQVHSKAGETGNRKWKRYAVKLADGAWYSTFDREMGEALITMKGERIKVAFRLLDTGAEIVNYEAQ